MFFQLTLSLIIGIVVETQSDSIYDYDFFDYCGSLLEVRDRDLARLCVKGGDANTNLCEVTLKAAVHTDHLVYKFTEYSSSSKDVTVRVYSRSTLIGTRSLEDSCSNMNSPTINSNKRADRYIIVQVNRFLGTDFNARLEITTETSPSTLLQTALGYGIFALMVVGFLGYVCHRFSKRNSPSERPHFPDCSRRLTQCLSNFCDPRDSDVQAHARTVPRPSVSPADDYESSQPIMSVSDVDANGGDNFHGSGHSLLNIPNSTDMSPNASFPSSSMQPYPGTGRDQRTSVTRHVDNINNAPSGSNLDPGRPRSLSAIELSTLVTPSTTRNVQPSAPVYESGGTWGAHGLQGGPDSQNRADDPPSYDDCVTTPPPPSYIDAVSGNQN